jgi:hypothetical protein
VTGDDLDFLPCPAKECQPGGNLKHCLVELWAFGYFRCLGEPWWFIIPVKNPCRFWFQDTPQSGAAALFRRWRCAEERSVARNSISNAEPEMPGTKPPKYERPQSNKAHIMNIYESIWDKTISCIYIYI